MGGGTSAGRAGRASLPKPNAFHFHFAFPAACLSGLSKCTLKHPVPDQIGVELQSDTASMPMIVVKMAG
jgi:hypothetical protein